MDAGPLAIRSDHQSNLAMTKVMIAGGGLAGLAAAAALGGAGFEVDLFESRSFLGGRATSYPVPVGEGESETIDNCQHILLRCCVNLLDFYSRLGVRDRIRFYREFVFLEPGGRASVLRRGRLPQRLAEYEEKIAGPCPFRAGELGSLLERFRVLRDPRRGHGLRHHQPFVLACAAVTTLMGSSGYQAFEDTCQKFTQRQLKALGCQRDKAGRYAAPSDSTFLRVLTRLDAAHFDALVGAWLLEQEVSVLERLAVDGKGLRGSGRMDGKPLQLFSAVSHRLRLTLAQVPIQEKSNAIAALPLRLRSLPPLEGTLITADAMHCQQESARVITQELGGDYLFGLKGNQRGILERAERLLAQQTFPP